MPQALIRQQSPEEREYARFLSDIDVRKRRIAELQADLAAYKERLGRFNAEYHTRIGSLFIELDRIELAIGEYEFRIAHLRTNPEADSEELERQTKQQFTEEREQIHEDEEETRYYEREHRRERTRPQLDEDSELSLKSLYRELAKRFHPDLAKTEEERLQREAVMKEVNSAFHERDVRQMRTISAQHDVDDASFEQKSIGGKLVWAIREVSRLDSLIKRLQEERATIEASDIAILWSRQEAGEPVIERLETGLQSKLTTMRERLQTVILELRNLTDEVYRV